MLRFKGRRPVVHPTVAGRRRRRADRRQEQRLLRIGALGAGARHATGDGPFRAARDLLMRRQPASQGTPRWSLCALPGSAAVDAARRHVVNLDHTTLAIQGPPGIGKTWCGARMILDLVAAGRKVGVTANSHKVIGKLLDEVLAAGSRA